MGRGRAKAKQQKVARDLKYNTHFTDLDALQRELGVAHPNGGPPAGRVDAIDDEDDTDDPDVDAGGHADGADEYADGYSGWNGTER